MALYTDKDFDILEKNIDGILEEIGKRKKTMFEPTQDEMVSVSKIVYNFIKDNRRKMYGGYALNMLIRDKNKKDAIYKEDDVPDMDFYTPDPIGDLIKLCNLLHDKGFKYVRGREAMHKETYSIFVNNQLYCDLSYVPKNVFNKMPFKEIDGIHVIHPFFMTIDYLRMLTDPLVSYWRMIEKKSFKRFIMLQKHYPLPIVDKPIGVEIPKDANLILDTILECCFNNETLILVGFYAYNKFFNESGIKNKKIKELDVPYYEIISTNYRDDARKIIETLKTKYPDARDKMKVVEHYPFFQLFGFHVNIYYNDMLVATIYSNNKRCVPYQEVKHNKDNKVSIGTFNTTLLYALCTIMKARVDNDDDTKNLYHTFISHLIDMRKYYFESKGKHMMSSSLFQDFTIECRGETLPVERERLLIGESRRAKNKPFLFIYDPSQTKKEPENSYVFANSSGNPINNPRNLKLADDSKPENDFETDDVPEI